jgi:hypothetical protein
MKIEHAQALKDCERRVTMEVERNMRQQQTKQSINRTTVSGAQLAKERSKHRSEVQRLRRMLERASRSGLYEDGEDGEDSNNNNNDDDDDDDDELLMEQDDDDRVSNISVSASPDRNLDNNGGLRSTGRGLNALVDTNGTIQRMMPRLNTSGGGGLIGLERSGIDLINDSDLSSKDGTGDILRNAAVTDRKLSTKNSGRRKNRLIEEDEEEEDEEEDDEEEDDDVEDDDVEDDDVEEEQQQEQQEQQQEEIDPSFRSLPNVRITRRGSVIITQQSSPIKRRKQQQPHVTTIPKLGPYSAALDTYLLQSNVVKQQQEEPSKE